jgi:hypothetical protein
LKSYTAKSPAHATLKGMDDTQENVGEEIDTQELVSNAVTTAAPNENDASNTTAQSPVSPSMIGTHLIEDFEVR